MRGASRHRGIINAITTALVSAASSGASGQDCTPEWELIAGGGAPGNYAFAMSFDAARSETVLFGGNVGPSIDIMLSWDGAQWTELKPPHKPAARHDHAMCFDADRGRIVLFGGATTGGGFHGDTWEWDGTDWKLVANDGPQARVGSRMVYDAGHKVCVLFGGEVQPGVCAQDTWAWDGASWKLLAPLGPLPRAGAGMEYDPARGVVVLFGGWCPGVDAYDDTWEWDGKSWDQRVVAGPPALIGCSMSYVPELESAVLFGGEYGDKEGFNTSDECWTWDGDVWTTLDIARPSRRYNHASVYDSARHRLVLFGGHDDGGLRADTWEFGCNLVCYADMDKNGQLELFDFLTFINLFFANDPVTDCDGDGSLTFFDFLCFLNEFNAGCP